MNINFDPEVNALSIQFRDQPVAESDEVRPGVIFDYDAKGKVVAMEILDASELLPVASPRSKPRLMTTRRVKPN